LVRNPKKVKTVFDKYACMGEERRIDPKEDQCKFNFCAHGSEPSDSMESGKFVDKLRDT
jgi:putative ribosome biogenesis GTPase RsgA